LDIFTDVANKKKIHCVAASRLSLDCGLRDVKDNSLEKKMRTVLFNGRFFVYAQRKRE